MPITSAVGRWVVDALRGTQGWMHSRMLLFDAMHSGAVSREAREIHESDGLDDDLPYLPMDLSRNRLNGWKLFGWFEQEVPVSFAWARVATQQKITEVGVTVVADQPSGWIIYCITPTAHRGHGFYPRLLTAITNTMPAERTFIYCLQENVASRRGIEKAGFRPIGALSRRFGYRSGRIDGLLWF